VIAGPLKEVRHFLRCCGAAPVHMSRRFVR
jgi:hypothetical protein